jgi:hypothetical protein
MKTEEANFKNILVWSQVVVSEINYLSSEHLQHVGWVPLCEWIPIWHKQGREGRYHSSAVEVPVEQDLEPLACPPAMLHHSLCQSFPYSQWHQSDGKCSKNYFINMSHRRYQIWCRWIVIIGCVYLKYICIVHICTFLSYFVIIPW